MNFEDRYAKALQSSNLRPGEAGVHAAVDLIGAAGKASKSHPLSFAILRLFVGDRHAVTQVVDLLTGKAVGKAYRMHTEIDQATAATLAATVLEWYRNGACKTCGGHGYRPMLGAPVLGNRECQACRGMGKREFDALFPSNRLELAKWLGAELEREAAIAGPAAMAALREVGEH